MINEPRRTSGYTDALIQLSRSEIRCFIADIPQSLLLLNVRRGVTDTAESRGGIGI